MALTGKTTGAVTLGEAAQAIDYLQYALLDGAPLTFEIWCEAFELAKPFDESEGRITGYYSMLDASDLIACAGTMETGLAVGELAIARDKGYRARSEA